MPRLTILLTFLLLAGFAAAPPVFAGDHGDAAYSGEIVLRLRAERWVETDTARVVLAINAAEAGSNAAKIREDMLSALDKVAPDAEWRFTSFNRSVDRAGLENWSARAQARLTDTQLDGLSGRAEDASRPGMQFTISRTDFEPSLADIEAARALLRAEIYAQASAEMKRVNEGLGRDFSIHYVAFGPKIAGPKRGRRLEARSMQAMATADSAGGGVEVANKLRLGAEVVLRESGLDDHDDDNDDDEEEENEGED